MINEGTQAPDFCLTNVEGQQVNLSDFRGKKVLLSLFRDTSCPICNLRVHELMQHNEFFAYGNVQVISIFPSTVERIRKYTAKQEPSFELLANPEKDIYSAYQIMKSPGRLLKGVLKFGRMFKAYGKFFSLRSIATPTIIPAEFIIDEDGIIIKAHYGDDFTDHMKFDEVSKYLGQVTPFG